MPQERQNATARVSFIRFDQICLEAFTCPYEVFCCPQFNKNQLQSASRCDFTKKSALSTVFLHLLIPSLKRKGKEDYLSVGQKSSSLLLQCLLISGPCEVTWKNKGFVLPACRAHREPKAKGFFLTEV